MTEYRGVKRISAVLPLVLAMGVLGGVARAQDDQNTRSSGNSNGPRVTVNGQSMTFSAQPPMEQNGRVLVPMRDIFEKLGAYVEYDRANQSVNALQGGTHITLPIGGRTARVGDRNVSLDVPAQVVNGTTLVPLRFVAESLGARVDFDPGTDTVAIFTDGTVNPGRRTAGERWDGTPRQESSLNGRIMAVYSDQYPARIVVRTNDSGDITLRMRDDATITWKRPNGSDRSLALNELKVGDSVAVLRGTNGAVTAVNVREHSNAPAGTVIRGDFRDSWRNGDYFMLKMADGQLIQVPDDVPIFVNDQKIGVGRLRAGDHLRISIDPDTKRATRIVVLP